MDRVMDGVIDQVMDQDMIPVMDYGLPFMDRVLDLFRIKAVLTPFESSPNSIFK